MTMRQAASVFSAVFALAAASWPQVVGAAPTGSVGRPVVDRSVAPSPLSPRHLYVLDRAAAVYRFPLAPDGLPATQPDGVMYPQGASDPTGVAVDKVGHIFVADPDGWGSAVAEFAAGALGPQQPISILYAYGPDRLIFDDAERLYVHLNGNQSIAIFAKGAHGHDAPISIVTNNYAFDYVVDNTGALYTVTSGGPVVVYDRPLNNPSQPDRLIEADAHYFQFSQTLALDAATDNLYIQFYPPDELYWDKVNYDVRPAASPSIPVFAHAPWIFTGDCGPANSAILGGTEVIKNYLVVSCNFVQGDVLVYRKDQFGRQRQPVETIGRGLFVSPWEMAVGP